MKKLFTVISKIGQVLLIYMIMISLAIFLYTKFNTGKPLYGNRCTVSHIKNVEQYLKEEEITSFSYKQECNTLYITLSSNLTKEQYTGLIMKYYQTFKNLNYQGNIHIIGYSPKIESPLFASITENGISIN